MDDGAVDRLVRYAVFLEDLWHRYDLAERYYKGALKRAPNHPRALAEYAVFLERVRQDAAGAEQIYRRALTVSPTDPSLVGNFAEFLFHQQRHDEADHWFEQALSMAPGHVNNRVNWATFLAEARRAYDQAETEYRKALELDPGSRNGLFKYALFLTDIRRDFDRAAELYRRGLELYPENPGMLANYAGLLLQRGELEDGLGALAAALTSPSLQEPSPDAAEVRFYAVVHASAEVGRAALAELRQMLEGGVRSPDWDLSPHVALARQRQHPWLPWLDLLAAVLADMAAPEVLRGWEAWDAARRSGSSL